MVMEKAVDDFNCAAAELQSTEFGRQKAVGIWPPMPEESDYEGYTKLLDAVEPFIKAYVAMSDSERNSVAARLSSDALGILLTFARVMSSLAIRRKTPSLIVEGLTALSILGDGQDFRDNMCHVAALYYSAAKLGLNTKQIFEDAARLATPGILQQQMYEFPQRTPDHRDLKAFFLRETTTSGGFDIVRVEPGIHAPGKSWLWRLLKR
jgi:hypothetical protein